MNPRRHLLIVLEVSGNEVAMDFQCQDSSYFFLKFHNLRDLKNSACFSFC